MPLNDDSAKVLDQVKKTGKPCKFVLISKGVKVVSVVAYRKGSEDARIREAKAEGNGTVSCGIVDGQGVNLSFKLLRANGYEAPPVKPIVLKDYLNEGTDLNAKPTIDIVDVLPAVEAESDGQPTTNYRSGDEWKAVLAAIQQAKGDQDRATKLAQALREWKAESDRVKGDLQTDPNSQAALDQQTTLGKVAGILKVLGSTPQMPPLPQTPGQQPLGPPPQRQLPPLPPTPGQQQGPPQMPPLPQTPPPRAPQRPTGPPPLTPAQQKVAQEESDRQALKGAATTKAKTINDQVKPIFGGKDRTTMLEECETDLSSDFGKIVRIFDFGGFPTYDAIITGYQNAQTMAAKYIKEHADPLVGKLPARVQKRKDYCQKIIDDVKKQLEAVRLQNEAAVEFAKTYETLVKKGTPVPFEVTSEMQKLMANRYLSDETKQKLKATIDLIMAENRRSANQALQQIQNPTDQQKAEILLRHGCFKGAAGGTSGVRLLTESNGSIAYAYKPMEEESQMGLNFLNLEPGASAMRESVSSTLCQEIFGQSGLDLGFPKSDIVRVEGKGGALIEGIKGKMADPEELANKNNALNLAKPGTPEYAKLEQERDELLRNLQTIPTQMTPESLQDVVLSSMLTCQWDCKWGNMIVDGNRARPIDGGTAIPTPDVVKTFRDKTSLHGVRAPVFSGLTQYPDYEGDPPNPHLALAVRREEADELPSFRDGKARADADMFEIAGFVVQTEQQRADGRSVAVLVPAGRAVTILAADIG
jgi:hypothetical protein